MVHRPLHLPSHRVRRKTMSTIAPSPARPKATLFWGVLRNFNWQTFATLRWRCVRPTVLWL